ncbi:MAG: sugar phosphate nucleotidyltransferase [Treponema sp.]
MNIIIPMAGAGKRFSDAGYTVSKPAILTIDRRTGKELPMVVCAVNDLLGVEKDGSNVTFIDRTFHKADGVEDDIKKHFPLVSFITAEKLTEGQACTCLLAKEKINNAEELLIAGCDNGMVFDAEKFAKERRKSDCLVFTYRHNETVLENPNAYGWMKVDSENNITDTSIKKAISENPTEDHAVVATFWFKRGSDFVQAAEKMIAKNDKINGEFYADQVVKYILDLGLKARVFEIDRYICWGTPKDYEDYQATMKYWARFVSDSRFLGAQGL